MAVLRDELYYLRGTITLLEAQVDGLRYEVRMRDIRLAEQDQYIIQLQQQIQELKKQALNEPPLQGKPALQINPPLPSFVKPNLPRRRRK